MPGRVLLCGAVYGSTYLRGLDGACDGTRIVGLLGRGGAASRGQARARGLPYYLDPAAVDAQSIDAVCVAVGGQPGVELAAHFLERGVPVLQEHPVGSTEIERLQRIAAARRVPWHVNGHFADLPTIAPLITGTHRLLASQLPLFVVASCNHRTLFSLLDILGRAFGRLGPAGPWRDASPDDRRGFLSVVTGRCAGVQLILTCQRTVSAVDDGSATLVCHHLEIGFGPGVLELVDLAGPVLWRPNPANPEVASARAPMWDVPPPRRPPTGPEYQRQRDQVSADALRSLLLVARGQAIAPAHQSPARQLELARVWEDACVAIGPPLLLA